ncbi:MAG: methyltransferase domain-containing protein [Nitrospinota bacterium]|jgi:SAM-dependent methyltransferase|nr:methyltransferase domain-containing protein [Nitrospinota bacterium]HJM42494.1 methyltransferase domain-containing protein [Nitrospinota bacterium]
MTSVPELPVEERLLQVLRRLDIGRAHFAARSALDWSGLAGAHPDRIASLTLICPPGIDPDAVRSISSRLLVITGDQGAPMENLRRAVAGLPDAGLKTLDGYFSPAWADIFTDRGEESAAAMETFLKGWTPAAGEEGTPTLSGDDEGEVAGISYRVRGAGPPLVLLPLMLAPSQWEPVISRLNERFCTITLGGAALGFTALLEARGRSAGYLGIVRNLLEEVRLREGETVLDVGCGTGVIDRWLARRTGGANRIVGVDLNRHLLREAVDLAGKEELGEVIEFREGSAEDLEFPDGRFDVTLSLTVMEELDADRMLGELVRVTKPGGRIGVIVRAVDMPWWANVPLDGDLKAKVQAPRGPVEERGCADASLYRRFREAGLREVKSLPQSASFGGSYWARVLDGRILPALDREEAAAWRAALDRAEANGTFLYAAPHHCAVGTKP